MIVRIDQSVEQSGTNPRPDVTSAMLSLSKLITVNMSNEGHAQSQECI